MKKSRIWLANYFLSDSEKPTKMGVPNSRVDQFWGKRNTVIGVFLKTLNTLVGIWSFVEINRQTITNAMKEQLLPKTDNNLANNMLKELKLNVNVAVGKISNYIKTQPAAEFKNLKVVLSDAGLLGYNLRCKIEYIRELIGKKVGKINDNFKRIFDFVISFISSIGLLTREIEALKEFIDILRNLKFDSLEQVEFQPIYC